MSARSAAYFLGIDGGGSKTHAVIIDDAGHVCGQGIAGASNHEVIGLENAVGAISAAATQAADAAHTKLPVAAAWLGLAGVDHPDDVLALHPRLGMLATHLRITNDAELLLGALPQQAGVAVIAGTGSIALGRNVHGAMARAGGWGHIMGDEGSGYEIGRQALQCAVRAADERAPTTSLLDGILAAWELVAPEQLLARVYQSFDKTAIAALAPVVARLARAGDPAARHIIRRAARELALAVVAVAATLGFPPGPLPLACGGGLLTHEQGLRELMALRVNRSMNHRWRAEAVVVTEPALSAARALLESCETISG